MLRPSACLVALALAPAALAAGCTQSDSTSDFQGEQKAVAEAVEDLQDAGQDGDARRICREILAPDLVRKLQDGGKRCEPAVDEALDDADNYQLDVKAVRVNGNRAIARVEAGQDDEDETLELVRVGREWRIAGLGGAR